MHQDNIISDVVRLEDQNRQIYEHLAYIKIWTIVGTFDVRSYTLLHL